MSTTALERVRTLAESWMAMKGDDVQSEIDRMVGRSLLATIGVCTTDEARLVAAIRLAESWLSPGTDGLFYPEAGQCVLDAIKGGEPASPVSVRKGDMIRIIPEAGPERVMLVSHVEHHIITLADP